MTAWTVLTATAGLIAFHIGLFTLVGRERKSPYVINAVFPVFLICLLVGVICVAAALLPTVGWLLPLGASALALALIVSIFTVSRTAIRFVYFVDSVNPKHLKVVRWIKRLFRDKKKSYEHSSVAVPQDLRNRILSSASANGGQDVTFRPGLDPVSMALALEHQGQANDILTDLAIEFIKAEFSVQYLTASRHPIEFTDRLRHRLMQGDDVDWVKARQQLVVIDAYSSHFAFTDSWLPERTGELEGWGVTYVRSTMTYAGMHSAAARAFKKIKSQMGSGSPRRPTLVIYEDTSALADLESKEQYRIFVRHVMPSERMWGGMFTVFVENSPSQEDWNLLQSYASLVLDTRRPSAGLATEPAKTKTKA